MSRWELGRQINPKVPAYAFMFLGVMAFALVLVAAALSSDDGKTITGQDFGQAFAAFAGLAVAGWAITQASIANHQAAASADQVKAMREQVALQRTEIADAKADAQRAEADAKLTRDHADRTLRATIMQRLDAQAPRVIIHGRSPHGVPAFQWRDGGITYMNGPAKPPTEWSEDAPSHPFHLTGTQGPNIQVKVAATVTLRLVGHIPARIDIVEGAPEGAERTIILTDDEPERELVWEYFISANALHTEAHNNGWSTNGKSVRPRFWVRDMTMNVIDEFGLAWNFSVARCDGEFLTLTPDSVSLGEPYAGQLPRRYEYFDRPEGKRELGLIDVTARGSTQGTSG